MIKKHVLAIVFAATSAVSMMAGGLLTNTNQNAAFLRQVSQEAVIDITGAYMNPAGIAFLENGFHLSLNAQSAKQTREINTTFPLFAYNTKNPNATHNFVGEANAPVIPSFQFAYVQDKWSVAANFAVGGGGGKCEFGQGLGSFEALYAGQIYSSVASALGQTNAAYNSTVGFGGYSLDSYMQGTQYYFGLSVGGTYKFTENLAGFVGLRGVYATCNYNGYVKNVSAAFIPGTSPADAVVLPVIQQTVNAQLANSSIELDANQKGFGVTPIIGVDWKINDQWNVAAKYEFKTRLRLENSTEMNEYAAGVAQTNATLGQFADGKKVAADIPAFLAVGVQYSPISKVRLNAGYHFYDDCNATSYGDKQKLVNNGTWEVTAGAEWDCCKWVTVSAGWQTTQYDLSDAYMNDLSFSTSSNSIGGGVRVHATDRIKIDLSYMHTLYGTREVTAQTAAGNKTDSYTRTNRAFGVGVNFAF